MLHRTARALIGLGAVLAAGLLLPAPASAQQKVTLVFSSGPTGGSWIPMAAATADIVKRKFPDIDIQVEPGGTNVNLEKIRNDKAEIGWTMATALFDVRAGRGTWQGKQSDKHLVVANMYPNVWQLAVPADADIKKVTDLKGKAVALPDRGQSSLSEGWELLLKVHGMTLADLGTKSYGKLTDNAELIKNRQAVAMGWFTTVPAAFVQDLGSARKIRLLQFDDATIAKLKELNAGFIGHVIPKGTYASVGIEDEIHTYQTPAIIVASSRTPADVIYKVTRAMVEGRENYTAVAPVMKTVAVKDWAQGYGVPLHPGAEKYYREIGVVK
jgi:TRAP transporter TAXI family solute receptor